jgi:enterochelin esterase family protein
MKRILPLAFLLVLTVLPLSAQDFRDFRMPERIVSPETVGDTVVLRMAGEYASQIRVEGSWLSGPVTMQKREGVWELKLPGLKPDFYTYRFIVDGVPSLDPSNPMVVRQGAEYLNSFIVEGAPGPRYSAAKRRGEVSYVWYESRILGMERRMAVYTPYGYDRDKRKQYPVLYLLHGEGDDEEAWLSMGRVAQVLDNLIQQGRAVPMIAVMPNCNPTEQASFTLGLPEVRNTRTSSSSVFMSSFINEVIPYVESHYRAIPKKASRAACGIGTGGTTVINAAVMYPSLFDFVLPLSCGVEDNGHLVDDFLRIKKAGVKLFWTGCGTMDTVAYEPSRTLHDTLSYIHLDHTFFVMTGGRDWAVWRHFLTNFAPMIFKYYTD